MKTTLICTLLAMCVFGASQAAENKAGKRDFPMAGGPLQHILEHAKELNLTAEQKTKLEALVKEMAGGDKREKLKENPEARELFKEMMEARKSGDEEKLKLLRQKMMEKVGGGNGQEGLLPKIASILTPEQMKQVREIAQEARAKMGEKFGGKDGGKPEDKSTRPDPNKGAPEVF